MLKVVRQLAYSLFLVFAINRPGEAQTPVADGAAPMRLFIDVPGPQTDSILGTTTLSGWAIDSAAAITDVTVSIDDVPVGTAVYGTSRPDVCAIYSNPPGCPNVGWTFTLDTSTFASGTHTLLVTGTSGAGNQASVTRQFTIAQAGALDPIGAMDSASAAPDFQLSISPTALTIAAGNTGTAAVQVTPTGNFSGTVTFTCSESSGLTAAACDIPGTVSTSGAATLIVTASSITQSAQWPGFDGFLNKDGPVLALGITFCSLLAYFCMARRRRPQVVGIAIVVAGMVSLTSCQDQGSGDTTTMSIQPTAQTGTVTVTATSGALTHTVSVSVTVNQSSNRTPLLTKEDVVSVVQHAATAVDSTNAAIAVTDRLGNVLGVYRNPNASNAAIGNFSAPVPKDDLAVALARTAAFFSNGDAPLSSRTVRYISGIHFPPGIMDTPNAALYGIENTNRGCSLADPAAFVAGKEIPPATSIHGTIGLGVITGKADLNDSDPNAVNPGGVPLFKSGALVGGVGVAGVDGPTAEYAAFEGAMGAGFGATPAGPGVVVINGISLPFVDQQTPPPGVQPGTFVKTWLANAIGSPGPPPDEYLIAARAGPLGGLSQSDVEGIVNAAVAEGNQTRAAIRLPPGKRARFVIAVADLDGTLIALYRMPDATIFSIDVAVAKSRNVVYLSGPNRQPSDLPGVPMGTAVTNRTISFGAQPLFPPGIDNSGPGPFFTLYQFDTQYPCTQGQQPKKANQDGVVFFPGSVPLYRNGVLVGGLGISGDGVDQDDFVANAGGAAFQAPAAIRADQVVIQGVRLPYLKFPRNPTN